jgi:nucleoside-diphosphate-sugar epimerase
VKVSVFGGTGFVGSRFCASFPELAHVEPRDAEEPTHDEILYLISTSHNYHVFDDLEIDVDTNLKHLLRVLERCRKRDVTFNFVSSWFVYGRQATLPVAESAECRPQGFYSITKKCAEDLLASFCRTFEKRYRILRLSNVYGEGDRFSARKNALQYMIHRLVHDQPIELYEGGHVVRDYLHVDDVARGLELCLRAAPLNEITNIGSGVPHRLLDLIEHCRTRIGSKSVVSSVTTPRFHNAVQARDFYLDVQQLQGLGFAPSVTIEQGLNRVVDAMLAERDCTGR